MYVKNVMLVPATQIRSDATVGEALELFQKWHVQNILIAGPNGEFLGEIKANQFAKMLMPLGSGLEDLGVGGHEKEAVSETYADLLRRLQSHLGKPVTNFMDHDVPAVTPDTPLMDALIHLREGGLRIAVVEGPERKLVGSLSLLTVLRKIEENAQKA